MPEFIHLHNHTQYSLLDGASDIPSLMKKAAEDGQKGVAMTDHGNMFGAFKFVAEAKKNGIKAIIGCEFYMVEDRHKRAFKKSLGEKDKRYHQLLLAKNRKGYDNISKLCSIGFIDGLYGKFPRIDKEVLAKHSEGIIATSCCLGAEIPQAIMQGNDELAEERLKWWVDLLGDDFYIELQRQKGNENLDGRGISQEDVNVKLVQLAKKYNLKTIATNDSHYLNEDDWLPHDALLCINTGSLLNDEKRFRFSSQDYYFKTQEEMKLAFHDHHEALDNTIHIYDKIEELDLARDVLLPEYPLPTGFKTQDEYLRHITYIGAKRRYNPMSPEVKERIDFELKVIKASGYPGYFLIVQDFTTEARRMGVAVGPGRGSAAGSVVSYCLGITNVDPIKYDLLFERFLNPERVSMPDIDIDFDDEGRSKVLDYVIKKYGQNQVAQIVTYGTMAAKSSIRDVGRVMDIPLAEVGVVAKSFPANPKATLKGILGDGGISEKLKSKLNPEDMEKAFKFRELAEGDTPIAKMLQTATKLEGSVRNTGIHACGVIITPGNMSDYVPVKADKDTGMLVTQFDNSVAEDAGLLKMDFLGLRTLSIIKDAIVNIEKNHGVKIDPDEIPLDDVLTYETIFQEGATVGVFQYESEGMQKHLKELKPNKFEDVIAMNALYRPGPIAYIPDFIARKHGRQEIKYDLPIMEEILKSTYGITVYQEQVMLLSQKLADFTKGEADSLRKAMGKKKKKILDEMKPKFIAGGEKNGHPAKILEKIWKDWEAFAEYAFNKSHSTCYAIVAFQTAYLKAHYAPEFMASVLTHNKGDITKVNIFLRECKRMEIPVLGPNVNYSHLNFFARKDGEIRFGLSAIKGVGEGPVSAIVDEREKNGEYKDVFDFIRRVNLRAVNKKVMDGLAVGGGLDLFGIDRAVYFAPSEEHESFAIHLLKYGNAYQNQKEELANSLFGAIADDVMISEPSIPACQPWPLIHQLTKEKEVVGIYLSGHPLDDYKLEIDNYITCGLHDIDNFKERKVKVAGIITEANHRISKKGTGWGLITVQDYYGSFSFPLWTEKYAKFKHLFNVGEIVFIEGLYKKNWKGDEYMLDISDIRMLEAVGDDLTKSITLNISIDMINEDFIQRMVDLCEEYEGKHELKFLIFDSIEKLKLSTESQNFKVNANAAFIETIEGFGLTYSLNK